MKRSIENLKKVRETLLKEDKDFVMIISGAEGVGKSALALILAKSIYAGFVIENVIYNLGELITRIKQSKKGDIIIIDEAILNLDKRAALTKANVAIRRIIKTMREFNLLVFVLVPQIDDLEKYIIKHRAKGLIRIVKRSRFFCYNRHQLRRIKKSKFSDRLHYPRPSWKESYPSCEKKFPELWKQYKSKKARLLDDAQFLDHVKPQEEVKKTIRENKDWLQLKEAADYGSCSRATMFKLGKEGKIKTRMNLISRRTEYYKPDIDKFSRKPS